MNQKRALLFILSFCAMQIFSVWHMAEAGMEEHEHNGQLCQIYLHSEHYKYSPVETSTALQTPDYSLLHFRVAEWTVFPSQFYGIASARAPPHLS